jgi:hypothetical protein
MQMRAQIFPSWGIRCVMLFTCRKILSTFLTLTMASSFVFYEGRSFSSVGLFQKRTQSTLQSPYRKIKGGREDKTGYEVKIKWLGVPMRLLGTLIYTSSTTFSCPEN